MRIQEVEAGDYNTVRVIEGKVVVVLDPWYDAELNPNRAKEKRYAFDAVFDDGIGQDEVYQQTARGLVGGVLDGYNSSVFAYGATGAGKTHTMLGSLEEPGVMVNTLHDMFNRMKDGNFNEAKFKVRGRTRCSTNSETEHRSVGRSTPPLPSREVPTAPAVSVRASHLSPCPLLTLPPFFPRASPPPRSRSRTWRFITS